MDKISVYVTASNAVRKTADDCRRLLALLDAMRIAYDKTVVDTREMMAAISEFSGCKQLPQTFVGNQFIGSYDAVFTLNEQKKLAIELRRLGYSGEVVGGENIPVASVEPTVIKKRIVVKKPRAKRQPGDGAAADEEDDEPPPPPPDDDDEEPPPPPPPDEDDEPPPPPPDEDEEPPPPPPDE